MTAAELGPPDRLPAARSREELRLAQVASGLLILLDAYRLTGRLPLEVQVQASRLRHAVKLVIQAEAARSPTMALAAASPAAGPDPAVAALRAWIAAQPWAQPGPQGWVYLLCFRDPATGQHAPLRGNGCRGQYAGHYWGWTDDLIRRISQHRNPRWRGAGRLVQVALAAGLTFELAWLEYPATRGRERRLKNQGSAYRRCPLCRGTGGPLDPVAAVAAIQHAHSPIPDPPEGGEPMPAPRSWLRTSEAAARLHVTAKTVTRWASQGRLEHRRTLGGHRRYDPELIDALVDALTYRP
jgi:excisionase family DNA binding protein